MVYKFRIISDEVDDFIREIKIDSDASFYDLHEAILKCTGYKDDQMTSFFICDDDWEKEIEITLEDMGGGSSEEDTFVMKDTRLSERWLNVYFSSNYRKLLQEKICNMPLVRAKKAIRLNKPSTSMNK